MTSQRNSEGQPLSIVGNPALAAGLSWTVVLPYIVLTVIAAVDVVTFHQVLMTAVDEPPLVLWLMVAGFTLLAITLSHHVGRYGKKSVRSRHAPGARLALWSSAIAWVMIGAIAFAFRWFYAGSAGGGSTIVVEGQVIVDEFASGERHLSAFLFLSLYIGTGVASAIAAHAKHTSAVRQYLRANRELAKAVNHESDLQSAITFASGLKSVIGESRARHLEDWTSVRRVVAAQADQLKKENALNTKREDGGKPPATRHEGASEGSMDPGEDPR